MKTNQIKNEISYKVTMNYIKQMLDQKIITPEEYKKLELEFKKKYDSKICTLFMENRWVYLIYTYFRVIYSNDENGGVRCVKLQK